jgi:hypothetical protein
MDPAIAALVTNVITVLAPFVAKGAEEFSSKVGGAAYEKAKAILSTLKQKWSKDDEDATTTLALFEKKPERYQEALEGILGEKLSQDEDLKAQLTRIIQDMGPTIEVLQKMDDAENVKGAKFGGVKHGHITHTQGFIKGKDIEGPTFGDIG